jgi:DNA-directed RNA polymerase subunit F
MNKKEARQIIESYKPTKGFFDLSKKPEGLKEIEYAKILEAQNLLVEQNNNREYLKKYNPIQWEKAKELSASLQQIIFRHWGDSVFV